MTPAPHPSELNDTPPRLRWGILIAVFAAATVARFAYFYLDDLTRQTSGTLVRRLIEEGTGNAASAILFPLAVMAERFFPLDRGRWSRHWGPHLGGYIVYSVAHTTLMAVSRAVLFPALGQGAYDYGIMSVRYFMEAAQDLFSYASFIGVLTLLRAQQRLRERDVRAAALERDAANARLEALSLRLQPHFLFNALNTISSTVYEDPAAADELIGRLGELLRRSLHIGERKEISLAEELEILAAYQALVEARFGDRIRFVTDVDAETRLLAVPAFLLQPLVENAVHHGASLEYGGADILLHTTVNSGVLRLIVENDTLPVAEPLRLGTGLGATRDRLRLMYGDAAALDATVTDGRFRVAVRLPARRAVPDAAHRELPEGSYARADR